MKHYKKPSIPKFSKLVSQTGEEVLGLAQQGVRQVAEDARDKLVEGIKEQVFQSFRQFPLADETVARKERLGLDGRVMMATGHYVNSIKVVQEDENTFRVGFEEGEKAVDEQGRPVDIELDQVARAHEFGTSTLPARPHWRPVFDEIKRKTLK